MHCPDDVCGFMCDSCDAYRHQSGGNKTIEYADHERAKVGTNTTLQAFCLWKRLRAHMHIRCVFTSNGMPSPKSEPVFVIGVLPQHAPTTNFTHDPHSVAPREHIQLVDRGTSYQAWFYSIAGAAFTSFDDFEFLATGCSWGYILL